MRTDLTLSSASVNVLYHSLLGLASGERFVRLIPSSGLPRGNAPNRFPDPDALSRVIRNEQRVSQFRRSGRFF
jgi:hypothetical protein